MIPSPARFSDSNADMMFHPHSDTTLDCTIPSLHFLLIRFSFICAVAKKWLESSGIVSNPHD
jgi:hypothetical protein